MPLPARSKSAAAPKPTLPRRLPTSARCPNRSAAARYSMTGGNGARHDPAKVSSSCFARIAGTWADALIADAHERDHHAAGYRHRRHRVLAPAVAADDRPAGRFAKRRAEDDVAEKVAVVHEPRG